MAELSNNATVTESIGVGPRTFVVTFSKTSISLTESNAAIKKAETEGNTVVGTQLDTNVTTVLLQGAGITAGSNYGATGVTSAVYATFTQ